MTQVEFPARKSDPATSYGAARNYIQNGNQAMVKKKIMEAMLKNRSRLTASEIDKLAGVRCAHKRMIELKRMGLVARRDPRQCTVTGQYAATWSIR